MIALDVVLLLSRGRPSAISGFVISSPINSVDGCSIRSQPHIGEEINEGLAPPIANRYSLCSVLRVFDVLRAIAPIKHCAIGDIGRAFSGIRSVPMLSACRSGSTGYAAIFPATRRGPAWRIPKLELGTTGQTGSCFSWLRSGHAVTLTQTRGGGRVLPGLVARRAAEAALLTS